MKVKDIHLYCWFLLFVSCGIFEPRVNALHSSQESALSDTLELVHKNVQFKNKKINRIWASNRRVVMSYSDDEFKPEIYYWSAGNINLSRLRHFYILDISEDPRKAQEGYYYLPQKKLIVHYKLLRDSQNYHLVEGVTLKKLAYDENHFGLKIIRGDTINLQSNNFYLITEIKKNKPFNWSIHSKMIKKDSF